MAIFYNKIQRKNPLKPDEPGKWYPVLRRTNLLKEKQVAKQIADETTLNPKEAEMALAQLQKVMIRTLLNGQSIQLGDWGTFYLTLNAEGADTEAQVTSASVKKINIRFSAGAELKEAIAKAEFIEAISLSKPQSTTEKKSE